MSCATESLLRRSVARNHHPIASLLKLTQRRLSRLQLSRECSSWTSTKLRTQLDSPSRRFMAKVTEGIHHRPDSHYELPLPLLDESLALSNNKKLAFHRLQHLKLRFGRDEKYKKEYTAFMSDIIRKGYAEKISSLEETRQDGRIWYLPHHGVYHPQKRDKIRVVFDLLSRVQG